jgi:hypothetical protein
MWLRGDKIIAKPEVVWFALFGRLIVVAAGFVMSRDMFHGVKERRSALSRRTRGDC